MNEQTFIKLHNDAIGLGEMGGKINATLGKMFNNKQDRSKYLEWITTKAKDSSAGEIVQKQFAKQIKAVQKNINLTNTQKLMLWGEVRTDALTEKVRLIRANKPLLDKGDCTETDVKNKTYFFITEPVAEPPKHDFKTDLDVLMKRYGATMKDIPKALK